MNVQQQTSESVATPVAPVDGSNGHSSAARSAKTYVEEPPVDDADALQPAAPTLDFVASESESARTPTQSVGASSHTNDAAPTVAGADVPHHDIDASRHEWFDDDLDLEPGASPAKEPRVAPLHFGTNAANDLDSIAERDDEPAMWSDAPQSVDDLISLPSPVATAAHVSAFDVFATSPVKNVPSATSEEAVDAESASHEATSRGQPSAETLASDIAALAMSSSAADEPPASLSGDDEASDHKYESDWADEATDDADALLAQAEMLDNLSITATAPLTIAPDSNDSETDTSFEPSIDHESQSQLAAASPVSSAPASPVVAADSREDEPEPNEASQTSTAAVDPLQQLDSPTQAAPSPSLDDGEAAAKSPTTQHAANELEPHREQAPATPATPPTTAAAQSPATAPPAPTTVRNTRTSAATSRSTTTKDQPHVSKASKATSASMSAQRKPAAAATKEVKLKNGRVVSHATTPKTKASDSVKVKAPAAAPTRTGVVKSKPVSSHDSAPSSSSTATQSSKPRAMTAVSATQKRERVPRAVAKPPVPPPSASSSIDAATAVGTKHHKASNAAPPPAPVATTELNGPKSLKKRLSASELEAASNRLYSDALESKKRKEVRKAELEESFSFAPQVNATKRSAVPDERNRFVQLHAKAMEAAKRKDELKLKRDKAECTFKPTITAKAKKLTAKSTKPRFENLYQQAHEIQQKRADKKHANEQQAVDACSFKPKIKALKSPLKARPLYDAERLKQKKLALEQKKLETELSECTFKPKVVVAKTSKAKGDDAAANKVGSDAALFDRLYQASQKRAENLEKLRLEHEQQVKAVATFHPKISSTGAAKGSTGANKQPFHERLYSKDHMQKITADREQKKLEEEQRFSYKPQITAVPDDVKPKPSSASNSPDKSIFERLYDEKDKLKEKIELSEAIKKEKEMVGCTFHPHIESSSTSPSHPKDAPTAPIWERLLGSYDKHQVLEARERQRQQLEMQECTFKPTVTPSEFFTPKQSPSVGIFDRLTGGSSGNGGAASMPSTEMKRRASERKGCDSVQYDKRRSVPELGAFKGQSSAASVGAMLKASSIVATPEDARDISSANQPRSDTSSLEQDVETENREHTKTESGAPSSMSSTRNGSGSSASLAKIARAESPMDERARPEDSNSGANNTEQQSSSYEQSTVDMDHDAVSSSPL